MFNLIIDTKTKGHKDIIRHLKRLKSTVDIVDNGYYRHCPECSQIAITTTLSEDQLDKYLWKNNLPYIGVIENDNTN